MCIYIYIYQWGAPLSTRATRASAPTDLAPPPLYYTILYYTILYYTILYYTIPYHTILYDIPPPASRRGRDRRGSYGGATDPLHFVTFASRAHMLSYFATFRPHYSAKTYHRESNCGTSVTTPFVLTPSESCVNSSARRPRKALKLYNPFPRLRLLLLCSFLLL